MAEVIITDEDLKKEYRNGKLILIFGIICLIIGLAFIPFIWIMATAGIIAVGTLLAFGVGGILLGIIQMALIKKNPEKFKKRLAKQKKYKKRAKKMAKKMAK
ncbi:MAG: hypothetical protein ACFFAN_05980 [Promethearchaeota archaeon]